ncbi:MAG: flavodoxin domain-containing protein [Candidatus Tritonobacter lacicola]|nr:flavodoxin domain-containing protein [Candidatus Tritonobacter lacicola]
MAKLLIAYYSRSGNTERMAELIEEGARIEGVEVARNSVGDVKADDLLDYDAVILGSPTYYGSMAAEVKKLLDESVRFHGKLEGKVGGAFTSSANIGGGNETTIMDILKALLIHGMIIRGDSSGDHYGPVSINAPDSRAEAQCRRYGKRIAELTRRLS